MAVNGFRVVDADGHGGELRSWPAKLPERFAGQFEQWRQRCKSHYGRLALPGGGLARPGDRFAGKSAVSRVDVREGMHDPIERLKDMDLEGIDVTVNYSGGPGEEWALLDADFATALCHTINEAKAEFNAHCPERLKAVAILPMIDPARAAAELRHAVEKLGHVGMVTRQHIRDKNLDDPSFDVVWAEAERLGVPVCVHGGGQAPDQVPIGVDRYRSRLEVHALTHPLGGMLAVMAFTVGGVLHRFPKLRVGIMEANCWWLPGWLERLDEHWERMPEQAPAIDRKPSEYFLDGRCFIGCDPGEGMLGTGKQGGDLTGLSTVGLVDMPTHIGDLIFAGVFDRHPTLRFVAAEAGAGWVPYLLEQMDDRWWRNRQWAETRLEHPPSFYFRRNWMTTFMTDAYAVRNRHAIGVENLMWTSDFPHHGCEWPLSWKVIDTEFRDVPDDERQQILAGNAARLYGLARESSSRAETLSDQPASAA